MVVVQLLQKSIDFSIAGFLQTVKICFSKTIPRLPFCQFFSIGNIIAILCGVCSLNILKIYSLSSLEEARRTQCN